MTFADFRDMSIFWPLLEAYTGSLAFFIAEKYAGIGSAPSWALLMVPKNPLRK